MPALLILLCVGTLSVQNIFTKQYNVKCPQGEYIYSAMKVLFALLFFVGFGLIAKDQLLSTEIVPYSLGFATTYTLATVTTVLAIKLGSLAITSLILSYSLMIPTLYGFIFNHEEITYFKSFGILFLLISLFLIRQKTVKSEEKKFSFKWLIYAVTAFATNGLCSVIQDAQSKRFDGEMNSAFMIYSLSISLVVLMILSVVFDRKVIKKSFKNGFVLAAAGGICNGATNLLVMVIIGLVSTSFFFPVLSAGGLVITFFISLFLYKEKFIPRQLAGLFCGLIALILLNI